VQLYETDEEMNSNSLIVLLLLDTEGACGTLDRYPWIQWTGNYYSL